MRALAVILALALAGCMGGSEEPDAEPSATGRPSDPESPAQVAWGIQGCRQLHAVFQHPASDFEDGLPAGWAFIDPEGDGLLELSHHVSVCGEGAVAVGGGVTPAPFSTDLVVVPVDPGLTGSHFLVLDWYLDHTYVEDAVLDLEVPLAPLLHITDVRLETSQQVAGATASWHLGPDAVITTQTGPSSGTFEAVEWTYWFAPGAVPAASLLWVQTAAVDDGLGVAVAEGTLREVDAGVGHRIRDFEATALLTPQG